MNAPGSLTHSNKSFQRGSTLYGNGGRRISLRDRDDCSICTSASDKTQKTTNVSRLSASDFIQEYLRSLKDDSPEAIPFVFEQAHLGSQRGGKFSRVLDPTLRDALGTLFTNKKPEDFKVLLEEMRAALDVATDAQGPGANAGDGNGAAVAPADGGDQANNDEEAGGSESNGDVVDGDNPPSVIEGSTSSGDDVSSLSTATLHGLPYADPRANTVANEGANAHDSLGRSTDTTCTSSSSAGTGENVENLAKAEENSRGTHGY